MTLSDVLPTDAASVAAVAALDAVAAAYAADVPLVLVPVRLETRFAKVEVSSSLQSTQTLSAELTVLEGSVREIADRSYETTLRGPVRQRKKQKKAIEDPLYAAVEKDLAAAAGHVEDVAATLRQPAAAAAGADASTLAALVRRVRAAYADAAASVGRLRSPYQRDRLVALVREQGEATERHLRVVERRTIPALRLAAELRVRPASHVARGLGRDPRGRPLRPDAVPLDGPRLRPGVRVVGSDGTVATALGARRTIPLEHERLDETAEAVEALRAGLRDPAGLDVAELLRAAASLRVLPGRWKAELVALATRAARVRPEAESVRGALAAVPSDDPGLDDAVPGHLKDAVYEVAQTVSVQERLQVRIYPEALAVDTHEEALTEEEVAAGTAFWTQTAAAGSSHELQLGAWRALCSGRSTQRAAWIARASEPGDAAPTAGALAGAEIQRTVDVLGKRLAEFAARVPEKPSEPEILRPEIRPGEPGTLRPGIRPGGPVVPPRPNPGPSPHAEAAVEKAVLGVREALRTAPPLPAAVRARLGESLATSRAATAGLSRRGVAAAERWAAELSTVERLLHETAIEEPAQPRVAAVAEKSASWSRAARSGLLPDRFAVLTVAGGRVTRVALGAPVPRDLRLSLDPDPDDPAAEVFSLDEDGNLVVPPSIRWMVDYDEALAKGMAVSLTISATEATTGFDEVFVLGVASGTPADGAARLAAMIDAHHYTAEGLSLLPVGTATNNTDEQASGFSTLDDADEAFDRERGPSRVVSPDSDGARLARALGIDPVHLAHITGADGRDAADALMANRALYGGTLGHALEELAGSLMSLDARERLRAFVTDHVSGGGVLPAVRVLDQPYGVLPTVAWSRFQPSPADTPHVTTSADRDRQNRFDAVTLGFLRQMHADWTRLRRSHVAHAHSPSVGTTGFDAQAHFLAMLGLEATSVEASYRFAVNVAGRGGVRGRPDLSLGFGLPGADGSGDAAAVFGPVAVLERFAAPFRQAFNIWGPVRSAGVVTAAWRPTYDRLADSRAYGLRMLAGIKPLLGPVADAGTPAELGAFLGASAVALAEQARQRETLRPLAEILVRQALLAELRRAAVRILFVEQLANDQSFALAGAASQYLWSTLIASIQTSSWGFLFAPLPDLDRRYGITFPSTGFAPYLGGRTMADYLAHRGANSLVAGFAGRANHQGALDGLAQHAAAVQGLAAMPAERTSRLVREHLDLASHRLDAWLTGLAQQRLSTMRAVRPLGSHVCSYGWVENLRPGGAPPIATDLPEALAGRPGRPVTYDPRNQGFIQTPSPVHAVTAAILRSGYASQTGEDALGNEMSVNLSSARVRTALGLIDGVRSGNDLGALLGYRLERFLHEYYARPDTPGVELDQLVAPLRRAFPTVATVDPGALAEAGVARERYVVDGLRLVRLALEWADALPDSANRHTLYELMADSGRYQAYPWNLPLDAIPARADVARLDGLLRGLDALADALDALADLTLGEAVHQVVRGNHVRAAAVLSALAEGKAPPTPEIVETPRTGVTVHQRVVLQVPTVPAEPPTAPPGWSAVPMTPRGALEPSLNAWLGGLLGDPARIRVRLAPTGASPGATPPHPEVSVADLGLQPLDLLAILGPGYEAGLPPLAARVLDHRRPVSIEPDQPGTLPGAPADLDEYRIVPERAPAWGAGIRSIADVSALLESVHDLVGRSRAATPRDYTDAESGTGDASVDVPDLTARVGRLRARAASTAVRLARLLADDDTLEESVLGGDPSAFLAAHADTHLRDVDGGRELRAPDAFWGERESWRGAVVAAGELGVQASPPRRYASRAQVCRELLEAAESAWLDLVARLHAADDADPGTGSEEAALAVARSLLGDGAVVVPLVRLGTLAAPLASATQAGIAGPAALDGWLEGVAAVREPVACLADVLLLGESLGRPAVRPAVAQLPHVAGEPWLGDAVPAADEVAGRTCVVVYGVDHLPAGTSGAGVLVDEWDEVIPFRDETTGVAVHYDQPDATAPQCILVAVPPVRGRSWRTSDLVATLHDTLEVARNRTVELEHLGRDLYGQVLPLLVGELVPEAVGRVEGPAGSRVILDFAQNNPTGR